MQTWEDDQLGIFKFDRYEWSRMFELPAFSVFRYDGIEKPAANAGSPFVELMFEADDEEDIPTEEEIAVARLTINNHQNLLNEGIVALFNDILGKEPDSGMWWHLDIKHVREIIVARLVGSHANPLIKPEDLHMLMGQPSILVQESNCGYDQPCAIIRVEAIFEPEHGIGLLTDGNRILGTGYQMDVSPFE